MLKICMMIVTVQNQLLTILTKFVTFSFAVNHCICLSSSWIISLFQNIYEKKNKNVLRFMGFNKRKCQKRFYTPIPYEGIQSMIYAYFRSQLVGFTTRFWGSTCCERDDTWDRILHQDRKKNIVFLQSCSKSLGYTTLLLLLFLLLFLLEC